MTPELAWQLALLAIGFGAGFIIHASFYEFYLRPRWLRGERL
jgi:hypothetical protein